MRLLLLSLVGVLVLGAAGCEGKRQEQAQQRKQLLERPDPKQVREERRRQRQLFDERGDLLPSETRAGGVLLPKGLTQYRSFEREWYFKTLKVDSEKIVTYFKRRLMPEAIDRSKEGAVTFRKARIRDAPKEPVIEVNVAPLKGAANASSVYIKQAAPAPVYKSGRETEAQLEALRKHAD